MDQDEENPNLKKCKIVLVGEPGVGKTCIIRRFIDNEFDLDYIPSSNASFSSKTLTIDESHEKFVKYDIWDTAGQEKFRAITKIFYKGINAGILVYDITNKKSFEEIKNYWYNQLKENSPPDASKSYFYFI